MKYVILFLLPSLISGLISCYFSLSRENSGYSPVPLPTISPVIQNVDKELDNGGDEYAMKFLRWDYKTSHVVAYVKVTQVIAAGRSDEYTDCVNFTGDGYCSFLLRAEIKELYKGDLRTRTIEFSTYGEASLIKNRNRFLGDQIVFLTRGVDDEKKIKYATIENSTRAIKYNVVEKMRKVVNPNAPIDEADPTESYSFVSISKSFAEADGVVFADVISFQPDSETSDTAFRVSAQVKTVFKGDLRAGQTLVFYDDFLYRKYDKADLGKQVLYLRKNEYAWRPGLSRLDYTEGDIKHGILEKLQRLAKSELRP